MKSDIAWFLDSLPNEFCIDDSWETYRRTMPLKTIPSRENWNRWLTEFGKMCLIFRIGTVAISVPANFSMTDRIYLLEKNSKKFFPQTNKPITKTSKQNCNAFSELNLYWKFPIAQNSQLRKKSPVTHSLEL